MKETALEALLAYAQDAGRICPRPMEWQTPYELVGGKREDAEDGIHWHPAPPIVLSGWAFAKDSDRSARFHEHLNWAAANGSLERADAFLRALPLEAWHHSDPAKPRHA